jgi:hypothetical protein
MDVSGEWEGKLLDASGPTARVKAALKQSDTRVTGEFSVYIESARDCCAGGNWKLAQVAPATGTVTGDRVQVKYELPIGAKPIGVLFEGEVRDADPHALRALVGSYTVADESKQLGFEGGTCVLWSYRK